MADLVIPIREYIGESSYNWATDCYEWATNCDDLRWAIEYAGYANQPFDRIVLEIGTCYGGSVAAGLEMFHFLQGLDVPVHTRILGMVASMGTIIPLAGDTVECAQTAQFMVHAPSNEFWGTAAEIKAGLKGLDGDTAALAAVYEARTGADAATVAGWMSQDTWFTAAEALAAGLCTAVLPLRPKSAPPVMATEAQATARRTRFAEAVARADKRPAPKATHPTATTPAAQAAAPTPAPMATTAKPTPRAAAPAAKTAKPAQAREKSAFTRFMDWLEGQGGDAAETEATADGSTAAVQSTELANAGEFLYHDGALAVDSKVFNDEALTEATADGTYDAKDGQVITISGGIVTDLEAATAEAGTAAPAAAATATLAQRFDALEARLNTALQANVTLEADNARLRQQKPPMPTARAARANADAPDPKAGATVKQPVEGAGTL